MVNIVEIYLSRSFIDDPYLAICGENIKNKIETIDNVKPMNNKLNKNLYLFNTSIIPLFIIDFLKG